MFPGSANYVSILARLDFLFCVGFQISGIILVEVSRISINLVYLCVAHLSNS